MQDINDTTNSILSMVLDENVDLTKNEFNNPEVIKYLDELCSLDTSQLKEQLKVLKKEEQDLNNSIKQITLKSFPSIISTTNFVNEIEQNLNDLRTNINTYQDTLPVFSEKVNIFSEEAMSISKRWRDASLMLNKHSKILEFLEIIQLLDSCLRNAHYDEALKLLNYISKLNAKHGNIPLIADLANKSIEWKETMMNYLLKELYSNDDIRSYATSIEYLRKLEEFDESEIRLKFLLAKNYKIQNQIKELDHKNIGNYLRRSFEIHERVLLNTYEQYNQIFSSKDRISGMSFNKNSNKIDKFDLDFNDSSLLFSWIILKLNNLITELRLGLSHLLTNDENFFKHLLLLKNQGDQFSSSLAKVGLNFRYHFDQLFKEYLENDVKFNLNKLIKQFEFSLDSYNITSAHLDSDEIELNKELKNNKVNEVSNEYPSTAIELNPPRSLLQFVPLKNLCNELIKLFDKLASFIATSDVIFKFKILLEDHLKQASIIIEKYIESETSSLKAIESDLLIQFKNVYKNCLLVHVQKCYKALVDSLTAVDLLGIHKIEFSRIEISETDAINYNELNLNKIHNNL